MSGHTPGPWEQFEENKVRSARRFPGGGGGEGVCEVYGWGPMRDADARLIAAAPDLLDMLRQMPCIVCETAVGSPPKSLGIPGIDECPGCKLARAAIAKAEGKP